MSFKSINSKIYIIGITGVIILLASIAAYAWNFYDFEISKNTGDWAQFGDYLGGTVGPIMVFLSLIAILMTLGLQTHQPRLTIKEMKETRQVLKRTADAQTKQARASEIKAKIDEIVRSIETKERETAELPQNAQHRRAQLGREIRKLNAQFVALREELMQNEV